METDLIHVCYFPKALEACCIMRCNLLYNTYTCALIWLCKCMCGDCTCIVVYRASCFTITVLYTMSLCAQRQCIQCIMYCMLRRMWTWSVWSLTGDVIAAWECDTPTVPVSVECHLAVAWASKVSMRSCVSRCQDAAGAFLHQLSHTEGHWGAWTP